MRFLGVRLGAGDVAGVVRAYATLLDVRPADLPGGGARFQLARGSVDVTPGPTGLQALRFAAEPQDRPLAEAHGVQVVFEETPAEEAAAVAASIDHVVVHTADPARAIALWRDQAGLRLALDREFPHRGLRLLFFRSGGITLEYAAPLAARTGPPDDDRLWGVSYRVTDLAARRERLLAAGVDVSAPRAGMRPGTTVVTVRSGTAGVPTLLLQVDAPAQ
jgi:catechol 2,3-dioxygenase-like lactoylglutathione lyase family enzyme